MPAAASSPTEGGSGGGGILGAPQGTIVGVQTACYIVEASSDGLRQNKSLMVAAQNTALDGQTSSSRFGSNAGGATALAYCPEKNTEAVHAVISGGGGGPRAAINPELYFPFQCLLRDDDPFGDETDDEFIQRMRAEAPGLTVSDASPVTADPRQPIKDVDFGDDADSSSGGWSPSAMPSTPKDAVGGPHDAPSASVPPPPPPSDGDPLSSSAAPGVTKYDIVDPETKENAILDALTANAMAGINAHVISIGGSGTMKADRMLHPDDGIAPRLLAKFFEQCELAAARDADNYRSVNRTVSVSIVECFAEEFADLLTIPTPKKKPLEPVEQKQDAPPPMALGLTASGSIGSASSPCAGPAAAPAMRTESHLTTDSDLIPPAKRNVSFCADLVNIVPVTEVARDDFGATAMSMQNDRYDPAALRSFVAGQSLTPSNGGLRLRQHPELGPVIEGAQELQFLSVNDFLHIARGAIARRCSSGVKTNRYSHLIMRFTVRQVEVGAAAALTSVITLVDTATAMRVPSSIPKAKKVQQSTNGLKRMITGLTDHCMSAPPSARVMPDAMGKPKRDDESAVVLVSDQLQAALAVAPDHPRHPTYAVVPNSSTSAVSLLAKESALTQLLAEAFLGNSFTVLLASVLDPKSIADVGTSAMEEEGSQQTLVTLKLVARASYIATRVLPNFQAVETKAHAIRDEITALKAQLEQDNNDGKAADGEVTAKLQAYEDQLSNIQSAFDEKVSSHAELEAQCQKQRDALNSVQSQLESRRQQAEELDAFAAEIDDLLEQHRRSETRLRRERELASEREAEAERVARELSVMAHEQDQLESEMAVVTAEQKSARQRNIAAFFKGLLEQEQRKRDIAAMEQANKQLKMKCALQQAKLDKSKRAQKAVEDDIAQQKAVHDALRAKQKTLDDDTSIDMADTQIAQVVEVTQKATATSVATKASVQAAEEELAEAKALRASAYTAHSEAVRTAHDDAKAAEALLEAATQHDAEQQTLLEATKAAEHELEVAEAGLRSSIQELQGRIDALDAERRQMSDAVVKTRKDREVAQEALLSASADLESVRADVTAWQQRCTASKNTYAELCSAASQRLANTSA